MLIEKKNITDWRESVFFVVSFLVPHDVIKNICDKNYNSKV
jgi:hypothetical protein